MAHVWIWYKADICLCVSELLLNANNAENTQVAASALFSPEQTDQKKPELFLLMKNNVGITSHNSRQSAVDCTHRVTVASDR